MTLGTRVLAAILPMAATAILLAGQPVPKPGALPVPGPAPAGAASTPRRLVVQVGKSIVLESPADIKRVSVVSDDILEVIAISPRELVLNGRGAGETSIIVWQAGGDRLMFDVSVQDPVVKDEKRIALLEALKRQIKAELGEQDVTVSIDQDAVFLRGTVKDAVSAARAVAIASVFGKAVNLLRVATPTGPAQILLRVKFADVDRTIGSDLGINFLSTGAAGNIGTMGTQQYSVPNVTADKAQGVTTTHFTLSDALNIFLFRPDLNLGATIKLLENRRALQILAEPNLLTTDGTEASFLSGGEFPYPVVQSTSSGVPTVTIMFREFGIRLNFTPRITPRGTIELQVAPEVSSLDFSNGLVYQGFNIPALSTRKISTLVELKDRQSFAIAGLIDNRVLENFNKMPGLGSIPLIGKLFQSRSQSRTNTELLVVVTPEIVHPIPEGQAPPEVKMPKAFLPQQGSANEVRTPGVAVTGAETGKPLVESVPVEELLRDNKNGTAPPASYRPGPMPGHTPQVENPKKMEDRPTQ